MWVLTPTMLQYQFTFGEKVFKLIYFLTTFDSSDQTDWSAFYSPGPEIHAEQERIVEEHGLLKYIRLNHELINARYDEESGKWHLRLRKRKSEEASSATRESGENEMRYEIIEDTADFVLAAVGSLSRWAWPEIEGLTTFKGRILHSASWPTDESGWWHSSIADWQDKTVGVIGSVGGVSISAVSGRSR